ncbi:MAG: sulfite exporter TauE/SafE family protein [Betaproteobacteria bacterium]|nr:sulfite exporter TauE/SafE family protein [Betaproteobacteria bacterium]
MDAWHGLLLIGAGFLGGAANAIAGGGTFFTFPALLAAGVPPVAANASNSFAIWPGHTLALMSYGDELGRHRSALPRLMAAAVAGGALGGWALVHSSDRHFMQAVPWLLLFATLAFAFKGRLLATSRRLVSADPSGKRPLALFLTFALGLYGGYFNAGLGIMLLATLTLSGIEDMHELNGVKNLLATGVTSVALAPLVASGVIAWVPALVTLVGAVAGGLLGGRLARRIPKRWLEGTVIGLGSLLTAVYGIKIYG